MSLPQKMTMKSKLLLLTGVFALGFVLFGALSFYTLNTVKVNGKHYQAIVQNKDLLADVLPPPAYVVESYLVVNLLPRAKDAAAREQLTSRLQKMETEYQARLAFWSKDLPESPIKEELLAKSRKPADEFFRIIKADFIPLVKAGEIQKAREVIDARLAPIFDEHREVIDSIVAQATEKATTKEAEVASIIAWQTAFQGIIGVVLLGAVCGITFWLRQIAAKQEDATLEDLAKLTAINKNSAVIEFKIDGTILTANENFLQAMGYTLDEIRGRHHSMFVNESERNSHEYREFWAALSRGQSQTKEFSRITKSGSSIMLQASYNPIPDSKGNFVKVVKYASNVTEMALLRAEADKVQAMMEQTPVNVMFAGADCKISYANPASIKTLRSIERLLPIKADQLIGQSIDIFHKNPAHQRKLLADPSNLPHQAKIKLGTEDLDLLVSPIYDKQRKYLGAMVTWSVITEQVATQRKIQEAAERDQEKATQMAHILNQVNHSATTLASSAEELTAVSSQMSANADETSAQANVVSAASEQVSKNVQTVSTGVEEMNAAIREIAKNATDSARVAQQAVITAATANTTVSKLGDSSAEIGKVIKVITSIAEQTNLLALNATIEAARAGEAGKGFAVVANEVKELAKETAKATEDISHKIEAIQNDTQGAVDSIRKIGDVIAQINDISNTIASAVEEQTATAAEMSRNVSEAAKGTAEIAQNITAVAQAAQNTTQGATNCQQAASELARMAAELQQLGNSASSETETPTVSRPQRGPATHQQHVFVHTAT